LIGVINRVIEINQDITINHPRTIFGLIVLVVLVHTEIGRNCLWCVCCNSMSYIGIVYEYWPETTE